MGWAAGLGALQACTATHSSSLANGHQRCNHRKHFQWPQLQSAGSHGLTVQSQYQKQHHQDAHNP